MVWKQTMYDLKETQTRNDLKETQTPNSKMKQILNKTSYLQHSKLNQSK